jgi:hypothetical protein
VGAVGAVEGIAVAGPDTAALEVAVDRETAVMLAVLGTVAVPDRLQKAAVEVPVLRSRMHVAVPVEQLD